MKTHSTFLTNQLLIATPILHDKHFYHAVAYICEHNTNGAIGIIINQPTDIKLSTALEQMNIAVTNLQAKQATLYYGGPVQQERGFVIHSPHGQWLSTLRTSQDIAITTSKDILASIANGEGPQEMMICLGYAGWSPNQLEQEIKENAWLSCPADPEILFRVPQAKRWEFAMARLGCDVDKLVLQPGHA